MNFICCCFNKVSFLDYQNNLGFELYPDDKRVEYLLRVIPCQGIDASSSQGYIVHTNCLLITGTPTALLNFT
jgi:hypothetical protein